MKTKTSATRAAIRPNKTSALREKVLKGVHSSEIKKPDLKRNAPVLRVKESSESGLTRRELLEQWRQDKGKVIGSTASSASTKRSVLTTLQQSAVTQPSQKVTTKHSSIITKTAPQARPAAKSTAPYHEKHHDKRLPKTPTTTSITGAERGSTMVASRQGRNPTETLKKASEVPAWKRRAEYAEKMRRLTIAGTDNCADSKQPNRRETFTKVPSQQKLFDANIQRKETERVNRKFDVRSRRQTLASSKPSVPATSRVVSLRNSPGNQNVNKNIERKSKYKVVPSRINSNLTAMTKTKPLSKSVHRSTKSLPDSKPIKTPDVTKKTPRRSILRTEGGSQRCDLLPTTPRSCVRFNMMTKVKSPSFTKTPELSRNTPVQKEKDRREKLAEWLKSRGKTPSRFSHLLCMEPHEIDHGDNSLANAGLSATELSQQQTALEEEACDDSVGIVANILHEIESLAAEGYSVEDVRGWLDVVGNLVKRRKLVSLAGYWLCLARIAEITLSPTSQADVLSAYEQAARHQAQPASDLADGITAYVQRLNQNLLSEKASQQQPVTKPRTPRDVDPNNVFTSSAVKYSYSENTPLFNRLQNASGPRATITPVRRSTRISSARKSAVFQDHDIIYNQLNEIEGENKDAAIFVPNQTLLFDDNIE